MVGLINIIRFFFFICELVEWNSWFSRGIFFKSGIFDLFLRVCLLIKLLSINICLFCIIIEVLSWCFVKCMFIVLLVFNMFEIFCLILSWIELFLLICGIILSLILIFLWFMVWNGLLLLEFVVEFVITGIFLFMIKEVLLLFIIVMLGDDRIFELELLEIVLIKVV